MSSLLAQPSVHVKPVVCGRMPCSCSTNSDRWKVGVCIEIRKESTYDSGDREHMGVIMGAYGDIMGAYGGIWLFSAVFLYKSLLFGRSQLSGSGFCSAIAFSAAISACEKGKQWDNALMLLEEMRQLQMLLGWQGNVIFTFAVTFLKGIKRILSMNLGGKSH